MNTGKFAIIITRVLSFIIFVVILTACDTGHGMMPGSSSTGMGHWNWGQILFSLGIGILLGFLLGLVVAKRKK